MMVLQDKQALFLDRDGVINEERPGDYVKSWEEFVFIPGAIEAIRLLSRHFSPIFIVTNQRGVGRGVMTKEELDSIHAKMLSRLSEKEGKINRIYVCSDVDPCSINRKPNIGMALQAKQDYPDISLQQSFMVGNSLSDMKFGKNAGMITILVGDKYAEEERTSDWVDFYFDDLISFALSANKFTTMTQ